MCPDRILTGEMRSILTLTPVNDMYIICRILLCYCQSFCFMKKGSPLDLNVSLPEFDVSEEIDRSHRHFSGLLWLFPGTFLPSSLPFSVSNPEKNSHDHIYKAALNLLNAKIVAGGGHTSWSSVWEACLMARLRQAEGELCILLKYETTRKSSHCLVCT